LDSDMGLFHAPSSFTDLSKRLHSVVKMGFACFLQVHGPIHTRVGGIQTEATGDNFSAFPATSF
jgi:hypothetical protein